MIAKDEMIDKINAVKENYGIGYAKAIVESFGVQKLFDILPGHYHAATTVARLMCEQDSQTYGGQRAALAILAEHVTGFVDHWPATDHPNIDAVLREYGSSATTTPAQIEAMKVALAPAKLSAGQMQAAGIKSFTPNDIIATLLDIAFKAQATVASGISNSDSAQVRNYHALADAFAPLQQLPGSYDLTPAEKAGHALKSFVEGVSVTVAGKEALEGILDSMSAAAMQTTVTPEDAATLAEAIGYVKDWDTTAYPNLGHALIEFVGAALAEQQKPLDEAVGLLQPVNEVFPVRNYDDSYVEQLAGAVADIASDGKRFRTMMWMIVQGMEQEHRSTAILTGDFAVPMGDKELTEHLNYVKANEIMSQADPKTLEQYRAAFDAVYRSGLVPDTPGRYLDSAAAYDKLRGEALTLARTVVRNYKKHADGAYRCMHCLSYMPSDGITIDENHSAGCPVTLARQLIENERGDEEC